MLLRDQMEPLAQHIADTIVMNGAVPGSSWNGYTRSTKDGHGDLIPLKQSRNDEIWYVWNRNHEARIGLIDIRYEDIDPDLFDLSERITLASKLKSTDTVPFRNATTEVQEGRVEHWEETGMNEFNAVKAGFEKKITVSAEVSGGIDGIAEAGSPAHAGIDPLTRLRPLLRPWFPRTRGDRPQTAQEALPELVVPPHTRGSTPSTWM